MLTKRLSACAELVTKGGVVCDVGTDHAYLPAYLLQQGLCEKAVATDIHRGPLKAAQRTLSEAGVLAQTTLLLCDGLEKVPPEGITDVVIAGMGGETMIHILRDCTWRKDVHLILQPMTKIPTLRLWLGAEGFAWQERIVTEDSRYYVILDVTYTGKQQVLTGLESEIGFPDWTDETAREYARWKRNRFQKLAWQLRFAERKTECQRWQQIADALEKLEQKWEDGVC